MGWDALVVVRGVDIMWKGGVTAVGSSYRYGAIILGGIRAQKNGRGILDLRMFCMAPYGSACIHVDVL